jgi:hypothetical protein
MKMNHTKKTFNGRAFVSVVTLFLFAGLAVSGVMLQVTGHQTLSFGVVYWHVMHILFAAVFLVFASVHTLLNVKVLRGYLSKAKNIVSRELIAGLILPAIILLGCWLLSEHLAQFHEIH